MTPQNKYGAQRALQRNGELVSRALMVGVQLLEPRMQTPAHALPAPSSVGGAASSSSALSAPAQVQQQLRPHRIQAAQSQVCFKIEPHHKCSCSPTWAGYGLSTLELCRLLQSHPSFICLLLSHTHTQTEAAAG